MERAGDRDAAAALAKGRYRLVAVIGEGGQATVYRGWDTRLGVWRAIKVLRPGSASLRDRFEMEARTLARLKHPNLIVVHDVGDDGGQAYMVMDLASESLHDRLRRDGPLAPAAACALGKSIAGALAVAHAAGVIHRDIKPANILVDEAGQPLLSDFGIARVDDERRTSTDVAMGTPMFMAPEQRHDTSAVDGRADIYALGGTLYAAVVGHEPAGPLEELSDAALVAVPGALRSVLQRATARDPAVRYPTADAFRAALLDVLPHIGSGGGEKPWRPSPTPAPPPSETWPTWFDEPAGPTAVPPDEPRTALAPRSRLPLVALSVAVAAIAGAATFAVGSVSAGLVGWWVMSRGPAGLPAEGPADPTGSPPERPGDPPTELDPVRKLTSYPSGIPLELFGLTRDGAAVLYLDGATGLVWRHPVDGATPRARLHPELEEPRLAGYLHEDLVAYLDGDGHLALRDLEADRVVPFDHQGSQFELSPHADQIAWHDGRSAFRASVDGGPAIPIMTAPQGKIIHGMAWSPGQETLAFVVISEHDANDPVRVILADADGAMSSRPIYASGDIAYSDQIAPIAWPWPGALLLPAHDPARDNGQDHLVVVPIDGGPPIDLAPLPIEVGSLSARDGTLAVLGLRGMQDTWTGVVRAKGLVDLKMPWADEDRDRPIGWLPDGALAFESDRLGTPKLFAQRLDSPDVRMLARSDGVVVAGRGLARTSGDRLERAPLPDAGDWAPADPSRGGPLACSADGSCVVGRPEGDAIEFVRFSPEATEGLSRSGTRKSEGLSREGERGGREGVPFARLPVTQGIFLALSPDGRTLALIERTSGPALLRLCDLPTREWRELPLPDVSNPQGIAWRTDRPGWWIATAATKYNPGSRIAALGPDGVVDSVTSVQGWASDPTPSPDGRSLAFALHRRDMDVWVTELPPEPPR